MRAATNVREQTAMNTAGGETPLRPADPIFFSERPISHGFMNSSFLMHHYREVPDRIHHGDGTRDLSRYAQEEPCQATDTLPTAHLHHVHKLNTRGRQYLSQVRMCSSPAAPGDR